MKKKNDYRTECKVLLIDTEVSPSLSWNYGQYETNAIKVEKPPILLSIAWKWLGSDKAPECKTLLDYPQKDRFDCSGLVKKLWELMDECEVFVAHNVAFDQKMANAFFLREGLTPPRFYKTFCTLKTARKYFKLDNNKLDYLGNLLIGEGKTETTNADVWYDMLFGEGKNKSKADKLLKRYNVQDVVLLEKIYYKLLPYADNHPNMALAGGIDFICPRCGREADFHVKAYRKTGVQVTAVQYQCSECGGYITRPLTKEEREELAEVGRLKPIYRNTV